MTVHGGHSLGACLGSRVPGVGGRSIQTTSGISRPTEPRIHGDHENTEAARLDGLARGVRAALARDSKRAKIVFKNSRKNSYRINFMCFRAIKTKHYSCSA